MPVRPSEVVFNALGRVTLGVPAADAIKAEAERHDARRIFVLAGGHLATETDEVERIKNALGPRVAMVHHGIRAHAPRRDIVEATNAARDCDADLIVAVGGGSVTDAGKIVALAVTRGVRTVEELNALRFRLSDGPRSLSGGDLKARVICVPTTLSAGEYNQMAGSVDEERNVKEGFGHPQMAPLCVVLDPAITRHTPEWLWLSTGIRSVDHATETLASLLSNDYADGLAESGLRLLARGLRRVKADADDLEARLHCQVGAWQCAVPLVCGVPMGASHALGHAMGGYNVPHGYTSCVTMPHVQNWNAEVVGERQKRISAALGTPDKAAAAALDDLVRGLGLPRTLRDVGLTEEQIPEIARHAYHDIWGKTNPRPIKGPEDMEHILRMASER